MHEYMSLALNHLVHGFYQSKVDPNELKDKIGEHGDFITAPVQTSSLLSSNLSEIHAMYIFYRK